MSLLDWTYMLVLAVAIVVTLFVASTIKIPARISWVRVIFFLAIAAVTTFVTVQYAGSLHTRMTGIFIAGMMLVFGFWRKGLATWAVVAGLGSIRIWSALTKADVIVNKNGTVVEAFVGSIRVSRLHFNRSADELGRFLEQHMRPGAVNIIR